LILGAGVGFGGGGAFTFGAGVGFGKGVALGTGVAFTFGAGVALAGVGFAARRRPKIRSKNPGFGVATANGVATATEAGFVTARVLGRGASGLISLAGIKLSDEV
jgi:hypothetical protein